jgi:transposase
MRAYSQDLRGKVIQALEAQAETQREIAERFLVSLSLVEKLWPRWQTTGSCAAKPHAGGPPRHLRAQDGGGGAGGGRASGCHPGRVKGAHWAGHRGLGESRHALPRVAAAAAAGEKKSLHASARDTPRVQQLRRAFRAQSRPCQRARLKFVDEAGATRALTRRYGRAAPGERVVDAVPQNYGTSQTMLAALSLRGVAAPWVIDGAVDGDGFLLWVQKVLGPTLQAGDIVVMENLKAHKVKGVEEAITARGARLLYLSPSSPDFNPLELCWAQSKAFLRKAKARTLDTLLEALRQALVTVTAADARAWFAHCGYTVH